MNWLIEQSRKKLKLLAKKMGLKLGSVSKIVTYKKPKKGNYAN